MEVAAEVVRRRVVGLQMNDYPAHPGIRIVLALIAEQVEDAEQLSQSGQIFEDRAAIQSNGVQSWTRCSRTKNLKLAADLVHGRILHSLRRVPFDVYSSIG